MGIFKLMKGIGRQCLGYLDTTFNHSPRSVIFSRSSQRSPSPGPNHTSNSNASNTAVVPQNSSARPPCSLTPTLAAHFNENLIKHVQGWPADHAEKQVHHTVTAAVLPVICWQLNSTVRKSNPDPVDSNSL